MENKKEKQSKKRLGIVAVLLLLLLSVGAVAGTTLAKYISQGSVQSNQATVAKWGVTLTVTDNNFFGKYYNKGEIQQTDTTVDVKSASTSNVVAPGTKGSLNIVANGTPEVKYSLTYTLGDIEVVYLKVEDNKYYYPIAWKFKSGSGSEETLAAAGVVETAPAQYVQALKTALTTKLANENKNPGESVSVNYTISWEWIFEDSTESKDTINGYDTTLGDKTATTSDDHNNQIKFNLSVKMEQVRNS